MRVCAREGGLCIAVRELTMNILARIDSPRRSPTCARGTSSAYMWRGKKVKHTDVVPFFGDAQRRDVLHRPTYRLDECHGARLSNARVRCVCQCARPSSETVRKRKSRRGTGARMRHVRGQAAHVTDDATLTASAGP